MTLLYFDPIFAEHETGRHPECPKRIDAIGRKFEQENLFSRCKRPQWQPASVAQQLAVHTQGYLELLRESCESGGGYIEQDTVVCSQSWTVTQSAAGVACDSVDRVLRGEDSTAFCAIRPPGHHALRSAPMGFCLLNNVAVAARHAVQTHNLNRLMIIDWDVHHGNGTQAIFYDDPAVGFYSIHRWPFYPGTGGKNEQGTGAGLGTTKNDPIEFGVSRKDFLKCFESSIEKFAGKIKPELILLSAGFDAHRKDPVGSLGLETEDFGELTKIVQATANSHCQGRIVSLLEGGYEINALADSAALHLQTLIGE